MIKTKIIEIRSGKLQGYIDEGIEVYKGIPYAEPPIGELRFNAPKPKDSWVGVLEATEFRPVSPQPSSYFTPQLPPPQSEEDCLTLNVWTPKTDEKKRPVMIWIHGRLHKTGTVINYNGTPLAKRGDTVVVTINYRLGPLGFLYLPDVPNVSANVGLLDQIEALEWVKSNIINFGGDPENVTVFGQSSGAEAICCLIGMPTARGLINRIILQSGTTSPIGYQKQSGIAITRKLFSLLGIENDDIDCFRKISAEDIMKAQEKIELDVMVGLGPPYNVPQYSPVIDGKLLPKHPLKAILDGETKNIEILIGTNKDEMRYRELWWSSVNTEDLPYFLSNIFNIIMKSKGQSEEKIHEIISLYSQTRETPSEILNALSTDILYRIPSIRLAELQSKVQPDTYIYMFTYPSPLKNGSLGSIHSIEMPFVFGILDKMEKFSFRNLFFPASNKETEELSVKMMDSWISFTRNGNPNHEQIPEWLQYRNNRATMIFGKEIKVTDDPFGKERAIWDDIIVFKE